MDNQPVDNVVVPVHAEKNHRLATFIIASAVIALLMVAASMALYVSSGAEQLDLSRPGLAKVREQVSTDNQKIESFSPDGTLDKESLSQFADMYDKEAKRINSVKAFDGDPLSPVSLQIDEKAANTSTTLEN